MGEVKKIARWALVLMFTSVPLAFFGATISNMLDGFHPIVGIFVFGILTVLPAFAFGMTVRGLWKEWKRGKILKRVFNFGNKFVAKLIIYLIVYFLSLTNVVAEPKDLGVYGNLYPIEEVDLLAYIYERGKSVSPEEIEKRVRERFSSYLEVSLGVPEVREKRVRYVDPSITVSSPVYDHEGHVVSPPGRFNPLTRIQLTKAIVVLKESQLGIIPEIKNNHKNLLILLTDGNLKRASTTLGQMVYRADRNILERLGVEKVPSVITQEGERLRVEEIVVN